MAAGEYTGPMATTPPDPEEAPKAPNAKVRDDDARGKPAGQPGRGVQPFQPTEEQRSRVRTLAKTFPVHGEHYIARLMGFSRDTLRRHFADDMELGRAEMLAAVGSQMVNRALDANAETAKGDLDAQKYILARLGGWTTKVEMTGKGGGPVESVDLSGMNPVQLREYGRAAAIAPGLDPDEVVGPSLID
jgi:hypothetical protein